MNYPGYDALDACRDALEKRWFPYTPARASLAALHEACRLILKEGLERVCTRHNACLTPDPNAHLKSTLAAGCY